VEAEAEQLRVRLRDLEALEQAIRKVINGSAPPPQEPLELSARSFTPREEDPPRTIDAVRDILVSRPAKPMSSAALTSRLQKVGKLDQGLRQPQNTVLEAAKRLAKRDEDIHTLRMSTGRLFFVYRPKEGDR
jgi:hypothetical protein